MDEFTKQTSFMEKSDLHSSYAVNGVWAGLFGDVSQQSISWPETVQSQDMQAMSTKPDAPAHQPAAFQALFGDSSASHTSSMQADSQQVTPTHVHSSAASLCDSATSFSFGLARNSAAASRQAASMQTQRSGNSLLPPDQPLPQHDSKPQHADRHLRLLDAQLSMQPDLSLTLKQWQTHAADSDAQCSALQPDAIGVNHPQLQQQQQQRVNAQQRSTVTADLHQGCAWPQGPAGRTRSQAMPAGGRQHDLLEAIPPNKRARRSSRHNSSHAKGLPTVLRGFA